MDDANRRTLAGVCVEECNRAGKVSIVHIGHPRNTASFALAEHAKKLGATAISSMPPFLGSMQFEVVETFYRSLAAAVAPLPVIAYHIPSVTKSQMSTAQLCTLLDIDGVVGFK